MAEINGNQKELATAVGGLQQSSIYISEWVQTLRAEAAELRALVTQVQQEQQTSTRALASDVAVLSEDISGLRSKLGHQDAEVADLRETLARKVDDVASNVTGSVEAERKEVQVSGGSAEGAGSAERSEAGEPESDWLKATGPKRPERLKTRCSKQPLRVTGSKQPAQTHRSKEPSQTSICALLHQTRNSTPPTLLTHVCRRSW